MNHPFKNLNEELKNHLQAAINHYGKEIYHNSSLEDPATKTVLCWSAFGHEYSGWYFVTMFKERSYGDNTVRGWHCLGSAVIDAGTLDWSAVHKQIREKLPTA